MSMIIINDNCAIEIVLGSVKFFKTNFIRLVILQRADNVLPTFELEVVMPDTSMLGELRKNNTVIELNYGQTPETVVKREFRIKNFSMRPDGDNFVFILNGISKIDEYTNKLNIVAIEDTSDAVLNSEILGVELDISYKGNDKQVWIRHNIPEKEFVDRVLQNAYIADDDLILSALNVDNLLKIYSIKDIFQGKEVITLFNDKIDGSTSDVRFQNLSVETDNSIFKYLLAEGTVQPVYRLKEGKIDYIDTNSKSIKSGESFDELEESRNAPLLVDNGNCHEKYYNAYACNLSNKINFFSYTVIVNVGQRFFKETELTLLDLVKLMPNSSSGEIDEHLKGKYIITGKDIAITQKGFNQRLRLNRDYIL